MKKIFGLITAAALFALPVAAFADTSITLSGANPQTVSQGSVYIDPGYSAFSTVDGDITSSVITSSVDTSVSGTTERDYSVTDSTGDSASAVRSIDVSGGGDTMPYCSSPSAPGWNVSLPDGGCGGSEIFVPSGASYTVGATKLAAAHVETCPIWFMAGCMVPKQ